MFSEKFRFLKIIISIILLVGLIFYGEVQGPKQIPGLREFKNSPNLFINKELEFNGKIRKISQSMFTLEQRINRETLMLEITGNVEGAKTGDTIYAVAIYRQDKRLILSRHIISNLRPIKIIVSFIAFLWIGLIFLKNYTFNFKKIAVEEKNNA